MSYSSRNPCSMSRKRDHSKISRNSNDGRWKDTWDENWDKSWDDKKALSPLSPSQDAESNDDQEESPNSSTLTESTPPPGQRQSGQSSPSSIDSPIPARQLKPRKSVSFADPEISAFQESPSADLSSEDSSLEDHPLADSPTYQPPTDSTSVDCPRTFSPPEEDFRPYRTKASSTSFWKAFGTREQLNTAGVPGLWPGHPSPAYSSMVPHAPQRQSSRQRAGGSEVRPGIESFSEIDSDIVNAASLQGAEPPNQIDDRKHSHSTIKSRKGKEKAIATQGEDHADFERHFPVKYTNSLPDIKNHPVMYTSEGTGEYKSSPKTHEASSAKGVEFRRDITSPRNIPKLKSTRADHTTPQPDPSKPNVTAQPYSYTPHALSGSEITKHDLLRGPSLDPTSADHFFKPWSHSNQGHDESSPAGTDGTASGNEHHREDNEDNEFCRGTPRMGNVALTPFVSHSPPPPSGSLWDLIKKELRSGKDSEGDSEQADVDLRSDLPLENTVRPRPSSSVYSQEVDGTRNWPASDENEDAYKSDPQQPSRGSLEFDQESSPALASGGRPRASTPQPSNLPWPPTPFAHDRSPDDLFSVRRGSSRERKPLFDDEYNTDPTQPGYYLPQPCGPYDKPRASASSGGAQQHTPTPADRNRSSRPSSQGNTRQDPAQCSLTDPIQWWKQYHADFYPTSTHSPTVKGPDLAQMTTHWVSKNSPYDGTKQHSSRDASRRNQVDEKQHAGPSGKAPCPKKFQFEDDEEETGPSSQAPSAVQPIRAQSGVLMSSTSTQKSHDSKEENKQESSPPSATHTTCTSFQTPQPNAESSHEYVRDEKEVIEDSGKGLSTPRGSLRRYSLYPSPTLTGTPCPSETASAVPTRRQSSSPPVAQTTQAEPVSRDDPYAGLPPKTLKHAPDPVLRRAEPVSHHGIHADPPPETPRHVSDRPVRRSSFKASGKMSDALLRRASSSRSLVNYAKAIVDAAEETSRQKTDKPLKRESSRKKDKSASEEPPSEEKETTEDLYAWVASMSFRESPPHHADKSSRHQDAGVGPSNVKVGSSSGKVDSSSGKVGSKSASASSSLRIRKSLHRSLSRRADKSKRDEDADVGSSSANSSSPSASASTDSPDTKTTSPNASTSSPDTSTGSSITYGDTVHSSVKKADFYSEETFLSSRSSTRTPSRRTPTHSLSVRTPPTPSPAGPTFPTPTVPHPPIPATPVLIPAFPVPISATPVPVPLPPGSVQPPSISAPDSTDQLCETSDAERSAPGPAPPIPPRARPIGWQSKKTARRGSIYQQLFSKLPKLPLNPLAKDDGAAKTTAEEAQPEAEGEEAKTEEQQRALDEAYKKRILKLEREEREKEKRKAKAKGSGKGKEKAALGPEDMLHRLDNGHVSSQYGEEAGLNSKAVSKAVPGTDALCKAGLSTKPLPKADPSTATLPKGTCSSNPLPKTPDEPSPTPATAPQQRPSTSKVSSPVQVDHNPQQHGLPTTRPEPAEAARATLDQTKDESKNVRPDKRDSVDAYMARMMGVWAQLGVTPNGRETQVSGTPEPEGSVTVEDSVVGDPTGTVQAQRQTRIEHGRKPAAQLDENTVANLARQPGPPSNGLSADALAQEKQEAFKPRPKVSFGFNTKDMPVKKTQPRNAFTEEHEARRASGSISRVPSFKRRLSGAFSTRKSASKGGQTEQVSAEPKDEVRAETHKDIQHEAEAVHQQPQQHTRNASSQPLRETRNQESLRSTTTTASTTADNALAAPLPRGRSASPEHAAGESSTQSTQSPREAIPQEAVRPATSRNPNPERFPKYRSLNQE